MFASQYLLSTIKQIPADAEIASHQLMLRAGLITKMASGLYTWLPLGLRVLHKVQQIIREEMQAIGALECLMPAVQSAKLWQQSGRWQQFGKEMLKLVDRHDREFCFGPTHEEVITDLIRRTLSSYKQLPITLYQIQMKFRDEIRPRFGVMRAREFLMKDAYSFHLDDSSLQATYDKMSSAYSAIFERLGLHYRIVEADTGVMGGRYSQEFQVLAESGEDIVVYSDGSDYCANLEMAKALAPQMTRAKPTQPVEKFATPNVKTIADLDRLHSIKSTDGVKTLIVKGQSSPLIALILRGDHQLNPIKAEKLDDIAKPLTMASDDDIFKAIGCGPGSLGPVNLPIPYIVDRDAAILHDFVCGANEAGFHLRYVNWQRDAPLNEIADLRTVQPGDLSPDGKGQLQFTRGIEVGHIFQLGDYYCKKMQASVLDEQGQTVYPLMGCYGIGVSRIVAAAIEQHHDDKGIIWPQAMAPFQVVIIPIQFHQSQPVQKAAQQLYQSLTQAGIDVLLDDRKERPGVMFADMDLIGIPHRVVIGDRGLDKGVVEYKARHSAELKTMSLDSIHQFLSSCNK